MRKVVLLVVIGLVLGQVFFPVEARITDHLMQGEASVNAGFAPSDPTGSYKINPNPSSHSQIPRTVTAGVSFGTQEEISPSTNIVFDFIRVPQDGLNLQEAINQVNEGGIIEISNGTYPSPSGGFLMNDINKSFTIRAAYGASVVLDGGGARPILRFQNSAHINGKPVAFEGITFANGFSNIDGLAGGMTAYFADLTCIGCTFLNNVGNPPSTGGGGVLVAESEAFFIDCTFSGNSARNFGGGLTVSENSSVYVHNSSFINNRTNMPHHASWSAGGGIHVGDSLLRVSNSRFEGNQAGYVGGGIYAIGTWQAPYGTPHSDVMVANSTFVNNHAQRDATVSYSYPTEGGGVHVENQAVLRIHYSRFLTNTAMVGGGLSSYRAAVDVYDSTFQGNQATGTGLGNGFGGAISLHSNDTTSDGSINRPPASLVMQNSLIQGRYSGVTTVGQSAGGLAVGGDSNRTYGLNGVSKMGTLADNRATVNLENVVFTDLDVAEFESTPGTGVGGAIQTGLSILTITDSMFMMSDAFGISNGSGGALALLDQSLATISNTAFAMNTAGKYGGAIFTQGSELNLSSCQLIRNEVSPGISEDEYQSFGAALFTAIDVGRDLNANGTVSSCLFSENIGLEIYDDDRDLGPENEMQYNNNQFYSTSFGDHVYRDSIPSPIQSAVGLNSLVIVRTNGTTTDKSVVNNQALGTLPIWGELTAVPRKVLPTNAAGDPSPPTSSFLAYVWSGTAASLDGGSLSTRAGVVATTVNGTHTLSVNGTPYNASIGLGLAPTSSLDSSVAWTTPGGSVSLSWTVSNAPYLWSAIDHGVSTPISSSGSVVVYPTTDTRYRLYGLTEEGGDVDDVRVLVGNPLYLIFMPVITR